MSESSSPSPGSGEVPPTAADAANQKGADGGRLVDNWGEWGKRQALLGRVTAKQQQCQAIDQQRQQACSSPSPSPSAISEECKDLAKMSLACYGELLCGRESDRAMECLRTSAAAGTSSASSETCREQLTELRGCLRPKLSPYRRLQRQQQQKPRLACPVEAADLDACLIEQGNNTLHGAGNTQCYDKMEALQTCFASSICKQEAAQYRACLTTTASQQQQQQPREAGEDVCSPERLRVSICVQDHFFADMANMLGIPLDHFANK